MPRGFGLNYFVPGCCIYGICACVALLYSSNVAALLRNRLRTFFFNYALVHQFQETLHGIHILHIIGNQ